MKLSKLLGLGFFLLLLITDYTTKAQSPVNDDCGSPTVLIPGSICNPTTGTTVGATIHPFASTCSGSSTDDVWYSFTAINTTHIITVDPLDSLDAVIELLTGCAMANNIQCQDVYGKGGTETMVATGLTVGTNYLIRVFSYGSVAGTPGPFDICITNTLPNDNPCGAIALPTVTSACNYNVYTTIGATETSTALAPAPASCTGGSGAADGGYATYTIKDVWFTVVVPSSGVLFIQADPNVSGEYISDGVLALYRGSSCGSLTLRSCSDDATAYPGSTYDQLPYIKDTIGAGYLTPGETLYIRYWAWGNYDAGNFGLCVSNASNDAFANSLYICDLNDGYSGSTAAAYTIDRPCNMRGDAEDASYVYHSGVNEGGIFGQAPSFDPLGGNSAFDVQIDNNSWLRFTANSDSAELNVSVKDCYINKGIQMQIFSYDAANCSLSSGFDVVSQYRESGTDTAFTLVAKGLTPYQDYYIMIDGFAGDVCSYTIHPLSGILLPDILANDSVCVNSPITLHGPAGAASYLWQPGGQTTQDIIITPTSVGQTTYTLTAGGVCNKTQVLTKTITIVPLPTMTSSASPAAICSGSAVNLNLTSNPSSSFSWVAASNTSINGESTTAHSGSIINDVLTSTVGTVQTVSYSVTPTSLFGCVGNTQTVTVTVNPKPSLSAVTNQTVCAGNPTSIINFTTTTPNNATINWISGGTNIGGTTSGTGVTSIPSFTTTTSYTTTQVATYTATPVAPAGVGACAGNPISFSITVKPTPVISSVSNETVCGNTVVPAVNFSVNPNTSINWTNNSTATGLTQTSGTGGVLSFTAANVNSVTSGTVTLNASINGCPANTQQYIITVNPLPYITTSPTETDAGCGQSDGSLTGVVVSGSGPLSYTWTSSSVAVAYTQDLNNQPAGSYNLIVSDNNCTATLGPFSITSPGAPPAPDTASVSGTTLCVGDALDITASSTETNPAFAWSGPHSNSSNNATITVPSVSLADAGTYTVTLTLPNSCTSTKTVSVIVNNNPVPNVTSSANPYCSGEQIDLFGSGGTTYQWNGPNSFSSGTQNPSIPNSTIAMGGTYTLTITSAVGCSTDTTISVTVNPTPPDPAANATAGTLCEGEDLQLNATSSGATSFSWSGPNAYSSSQQNPLITTVTTADAGTYTVNASIGACTSGNDTVNVIVNTNPVITAGVTSTPVCEGAAINLLGSGGGSYNWTGPNSYLSAVQNPSVSTATAAMSGTYTLVVTNANNCSSTDSVDVVVNPTPPVPLISAVADTICSGGDIVLNANSTGATSYSWSGPNGFSSALQNPTISSVGQSYSGQYTVYATIGSCSSADTSINIVVNANPVALASAINSTVCSGSSINLLGSGGGTYAWAGPNSFSNDTSSPSISSSTVSMGGTYTLTVTSNNCSDTAQVNITVNQTPDVAFTTGGISCSGVSSAMSATGNGTINWYDDAGLTNLVNTGNTYNPGTGSGTYYVTVTDSVNGCTSGASTVGYSSYSIDAAFSVSDTAGYVPLSVDFTNNSIGVDQNDSISWTIDQSVFSNSYNASNVFEEGGNFLVGLYIMDYTSGCVDSAYVTIYVNGEINIVIPNIFTPNADGINDGFTLDIKGAKEALGYIYNRWGQLLYEWDALKVTWDGKVSNGKAVPDGIYFYIIRVTGYNGKNLDVPGNVTIIR